MNKIKIGFIGCGNMGGAIVKAVACAAKENTKNIYLSDFSKCKAETIAKSIGANVSTNREIAQIANVIFLGVKPQVLQGVIEEIRDEVKYRSPIIISMAAGVSTPQIEKFFGFEIPIIRIMPNTPVEILNGMVLYSPNRITVDPQIDIFLDIMSKAGKLDRIDEKLIDAASAVSGCGPAFVYMFIEALADGGVAAGLPRDKALMYATQTLLGSAALIQSVDKHPGELKDAVCSPGGSTIAGVKALENGAFRGTVINAVTNAYIRTKELGK